MLSHDRASEPREISVLSFEVGLGRGGGLTSRLSDMFAKRRCAIQRVHKFNDRNEALSSNARDMKSIRQSA